MQLMADVVVIIPGITGSVLAIGDDRNEVWGLSGRAIMKGVVTIGRSIDRLILPKGFGDDLPELEGEGEPCDQVRATRLMPDLHVIPGLWSPIKGYSALADEFIRRFDIRRPTADLPGNLIEFAYDWRLSNVVSARRLRDQVLPALERWRRHVGRSDAKLVLVAHSMGGLVARWFLEMLEGWKETRQLVTIGTPYQGSVDSLESLVNGLSPGLGFLRKNLTLLVRSFPSVHELLPTYACVDVGRGGYQRVTEVSGLGLNPKMVAAASLFHSRLAEAVTARPDRGYSIVAVKGIDQPTSQSAEFSGGSLEPLGQYGGLDRGGDGTVPRPSGHPPEWETEGTSTVFAAQRHATLQEYEGVFVQLFGLLSGRLGTWMEKKKQLGITMPHLVVAGECLTVDVEADEETLALNVTVCCHDAVNLVKPPVLLNNLGEGHYRAMLSDLPPGTYQVTVASAVPTLPLHPVSDVTIVWDPNAI
jgi:pimeloyl-ACP methyl ester carboxylesterase